MRHSFFILGLLLLIIAGCGENQNDTKPYIDTPKDTEKTVYMIGGEKKDKSTTISISHEDEHDLFEDWKSRQEQKELEAKHKTQWDIIKSERKKEEDRIAEEKRLENYCNRLRSNSCLNMTQVTDSRGCREVEVSCNRYDSEGICFDHEVNIKREFLHRSEC